MYRPLIYATLIAFLQIPIAAMSFDLKNMPTDKPIEDHFDEFSMRRWYVSDGWTNGAHQNCIWSRESVDVNSSGQMTLSHTPVGSYFTCSEIQTRDFFKYGYFEASIRADHGAGRNAAFFAYAGPVHNQPHQEIDFEILTKDANSVWLNRFLDGNDFSNGELRFSSSPTSEFHHYAFVWEPNKIRWYIDGALVRTEDTNIPTLPLKIYFSHWSTDTLTKWMGDFPGDMKKHDMEIDWFAYTPIGSKCQFPESIVCLIK
ncbi:family 16 glycosylhydrolase [Donghicola sp. C2-DW-16]|uniref:Family 16 glycosylhydrolase n=1 Tax=Donghicola mangrovi TaxID=2729614 RepID=A0ABX2PIB8_9RHOB|nr:family 16 glycosylhydrolase [Donghicola mangrovi]NVO29199.1 family 16 glycosylhydrolase [Donghicola mangrovi]